MVFKHSLHFSCPLQLSSSGCLQCYVEKDSETHEERVLSLIGDVCHGSRNAQWQYVCQTFAVTDFIQILILQLRKSKSFFCRL